MSRKPLFIDKEFNAIKEFLRNIGLIAIIFQHHFAKQIYQTITKNKIKGYKSETCISGWL